MSRSQDQLGAVAVAGSPAAPAPGAPPASVLRARGLSSRLRWAGHPLLWITVAALAARLYHLTYHSLWFDEVMSTFWAARPAGEILRIGLALSQDKHPPLYYLLLHAWTTLLGGPGSVTAAGGSSDYLVRSLGALIGALAVLPVYGIGCRLGGRLAGRIAALLVALNPFLVWYSQEARMFMPATTFALTALYGVLALSEPGSAPGDQSRSRPNLVSSSIPWSILGWIPRPLASLLVVAGFTAALYSYLFSAFLLPVAGLWVLVAWWLQRKGEGAGRRFWWGAASLALVALLFVPLARAAWSVSGSEATPGRAFAGMWSALWQLLPIYLTGWPHWSGAAIAAVAGVACVVLLLGLVAYSVPRRGPATGERVLSRAGGLFLAIWLALPLLAGGLLLARDRTVFAETRYFIFLVPALGLIAGRGLAALWRLRRAAGLVGLAAVFGVTLVALPAIWTPENRREDWRDAAAYVLAHAGPHDAVLVEPDYVHPAFDRYFTGPQDKFYPFTDRLADEGQVERSLSGLANYDAVWLVQSHFEEFDPRNLVAGWFGARYPLISEGFPRGIAIRGYATRYRTPVVPPLSGAGQSGPTDGPYDFGGLRLLRCDYQPAALAARDDLFHPPSGWLHVTTYWTATAALRTDVYPKVRLLDGAGQVWGDKLERDNSAIRIWPTTRWQLGEVVRVDYDVNLNPVTPAGTYRLAIEGDDARQSTSCGQVRVTP